MKFTIAVFSIFSLAGGIAVGASLHKKQDDDGPNREIAEVMDEAHMPNGGLLKKVILKQASDEEKKQLLDLYIDLLDNEPPQGEAAEWKMQAGRAMAAAARIVVGRDGAEKELRAAADCKSCHDKFQPK